MKIEENFTDTTKTLYEELTSKGFNISIGVEPEREEELGSVWGIVGEYTIVSTTDSPNPSAFAHELLHIDLFTLGFQETDPILRVVNNPDYFFNRNFAAELNNHLAHFKMIKKFVELGFDRNKFFCLSLDKEFENLHKRINSIDPSIKDGLMEDIVLAYAVVRFFKEHFGKDTTTFESILSSHDSFVVTTCRKLFTDWIAQPNADNLSFFVNLKNRLKAGA